MDYSTYREDFFPGVDQKMSLYIPRVDTRALPRVGGNTEEYEEAAKKFIADQFKFQKVGEVNRVDLIIKKTPQDYIYYSAFIYFDQWYSTPQARHIQETIFVGHEKATLKFHRDWFWIVAKNHKPRNHTGSVSATKGTVVTVDEKVEMMHKEIETYEKKIEHLKQMIAALKPEAAAEPSAAEPSAAEPETLEKPALVRSVAE